MSQATPYSPAHAFVTDSATLANFPGQQLDVEFQNVKTTTDQLRTNAALIQRDDGGLANGLVTFDSLAPALQSSGLAPAIPWATATTYQIGASVIQTSSLYRCLIAHTAVTFATDLAAGKWVLVSSLVYSAGANLVLTGSTFSLSPTPALGAATATSINGNVFTSGTYTLTGGVGKTFTFSNTLTLAGTDGATLTFQGTDTYVGRATTDTLTNKTLTAPTINGATIATSTYNGNTLTAGSWTLTGTAAKTLTFSNSLTLAGTDGTTLTFQGTDTYVGRATTDTLTNKTFDTAATGNVFKINGVGISANTGTGSNVLATAPTLTTPILTGVADGSAAAAGNVGEYIESVIAAGSPVSIASGTAKTITSISLTAGDWDVDCLLGTATAASTSVTQIGASISQTTNTMDFTNGRTVQFFFPATVPGAATNAWMIPVQPVRISLSGTTTIYMVVLSVFTVSTLNGYGLLRARRIR